MVETPISSFPGPINLSLTLFHAFLLQIRLCFGLFMPHTLSLCLSGRDCVTNTQTSVVHLSRLFHSLSAIPSYSICGFKPRLTRRWPLPCSGQNRKRKQTGISGGSYLLSCSGVVEVSLWYYSQQRAFFILWHVNKKKSNPVCSR